MVLRLRLCANMTIDGNLCQRSRKFRLKRNAVGYQRKLNSRRRFGYSAMQQQREIDY